MKNGAYIDTLGNLAVRTKNGWWIMNKDTLDYIYFSKYRDWRKTFNGVAKNMEWTLIWEFNE